MFPFGGAIVKPRVENAPGLTWRAKGAGWEAIWRARQDLVARGFRPKNQRIWLGIAPTDIEAVHISSRCRRLQDEMLIFGRGGLPTLGI
jgi:hypothetical protein